MLNLEHCELIIWRWNDFKYIFLVPPTSVKTPKTSMSSNLYIASLHFHMTISTITKINYHIYPTYKGCFITCGLLIFSLTYWDVVNRRSYHQYYIHLHTSTFMVKYVNTARNLNTNSFRKFALQILLPLTETFSECDFPDISVLLSSINIRKQR